MKKLIIIAALWCSATYAQTIQTPDGKIVVCTPTSIGTLVCL